MPRRILQRRSATALRRAAEGDGVRTIVIALLANIAIAVAKLIAGLSSGSTGMLAEAAHSAADSVNEIFLAIGVHRDRQPPDTAHPAGHGGERFLWSFMAALASFLIGGCVSIAMAIAQMKNPHEVSGGRAAWITLAIAFVADGTSWLQSMRQAQRQAAEYNLTVWNYIRRASDPVVRAVVYEDSAALIGITIAALGLYLSRQLNSSLPDSLASLTIGVLLAITAFALARPFAEFLIGKSVPEPMAQQLEQIIRDDAAVEELVTFRAIYSGPEEVVIVAKIHPSDRLTAAELTRAMDDLDRRLRDAMPFVADVFMDVTAHRKQDGAGEA